MGEPSGERGGVREKGHTPFFLTLFGLYSVELALALEGQDIGQHD